MSEKTNESLVYTIEETAEVLGIGRTLAFRLASEGSIPIVRVGKNRGRILVPKKALLEWLDANTVMVAGEHDD